MMEKCEMCFERNGKWVLFDDSAEMVICGPCVKELKAAGESVKPISA